MGAELRSDEILCRKCGYALRGLIGQTCPECGTTFDLADPTTLDTVPADAAKLLKESMAPTNVRISIGRETITVDGAIQPMASEVLPPWTKLRIIHSVASQRNYETPDPAMIEVLKAKSGAERLRMASRMFVFARELVVQHIRAMHPEWDSVQVNQEAARRISHGACRTAALRGQPA